MSSDAPEYKCIEFPVLDPADVSEKFRNDVIFATTFKLKPGTTDYKDRQNQIDLKRFAYQVVNDDRREHQMQMLQQVRPYIALAYYDLSKPDSWCVANFFEHVSLSVDWEQGLRADEKVYIRLELGHSVGCPHYIRGAQLRCVECGRWYTCRLCHDDVEDHRMQRFLTQEMRCIYCGLEQAVQQYCVRCERQLANQFDPISRTFCGMGNEASPMFRCEKCNRCVVGWPDQTTHCDACNRCIQKHSISQHVCTPYQEDCMVCCGPLKDSIYGKVVLRCGHQLHEHCLAQLFSQGQTACPVCRKYMPTREHRQKIVQELKKWQECSFQLTEALVDVQCLDCRRRFTRMQHHMYYCPYCDLFNTEELGPSPHDAQLTVVTDAQDVLPRPLTLDGVNRELIERFGSSFDQTVDTVNSFLEETVSRDELLFLMAVTLNTGEEDYGDFCDAVAALHRRHDQ